MERERNRAQREGNRRFVRLDPRSWTGHGAVTASKPAAPNLPQTQASFLPIA